MDIYRTEKESIKYPSTSGNSFAPKSVDYPISKINFYGNFLKQDSVFLHKNVVNLYIAYKLNTWSGDLNTDLTLGDCLFGAAKLTKKMLIQINMYIVVKALDLVHIHNFRV